MAEQGKKSGDLREACVKEALAIIAKGGIDSLSLRDVARRLGVSHQAPYKHFPSRDHILAEVVGRAYADFAAHLEKRARSDDPYEDLGLLGRAYLDYARKHPLHYQLMFSTPLPDPAQHPDMMNKAEHAFASLREAIAKLPGREPGADVELDALYAWSVVHGLASILQTRATQELGIRKATVAEATAHTLRRIGTALGRNERDN
ncbi:MAG: TetR/AcrR family transcriptional regulator [Bradyrhizobium icense]|jgi:AcrR family transcriptional regulator|nr:MAG: TetR/AcrR family transcriptional regulator [Bradyrhizobium icense]